MPGGLESADTSLKLSRMDKVRTTKRNKVETGGLGADELLEGASGRDYLDVELCRSHDIAVRFHEYEHPRYPQRAEPFISHLSALDLILNVGIDEARHVLEAGAKR